MKQFVELQAAYEAVPYTSIESNEPYGAGDDPAAKKQRGQAKREFLAGAGDWPALDYPLLDTDELVDSERQYWHILNTVQDAAEITPEVSDTFYEIVAIKLAEVNRHREIVRLGRLTVTNSDLTEESRNRAATMSEEIFGEVEQASFQGLLVSEIDRALRALDSPSRGMADTALEYITLLGMKPEQARRMVAETPALEIPELQPATIETIRGDIFALFPALESALQPYMGREVDTPAPEALPVFWAALDGLGLTRKGWKPRLLENSTQSAETQWPQKEITYGDKRADFTPTSVTGTPFHESVHALRYQNASEQPEGVRRLTQPGSLAFEEAFPVALEQVLSGVTRVGGIKYYLQLGLFKGMHMPEGEQLPQTSRTVNKLMLLSAALQQAESPSKADEAKLPSKTYGAVLRTSRGGARDSRDISYFEARQAVKFLNETAQLPEEIRRKRLAWVFSGRFDPTISKQAATFGGDPAQAFLAQG